MSVLGRLMLTRPLAVLDCETTGLSPRDSRIVELVVQVFATDGWRCLHQWLLNPGVPIPKEASEVHGITDATVADQPAFNDVAQEILGVFGDADLCGFNARKYDIPLLCYEFLRAGHYFPIKGRAIVDVCELYHMRERRDLTAASRFYLDREHNGHRALADVNATVDVLRAMTERYDDLPCDVPAIDKLLRSKGQVDLAGMFRADAAGNVTFAKGKHEGKMLIDVKRTDRSYLEWMLRGDFFEDTKEIVKGALAQ